MAEKPQTPEAKPTVDAVAATGPVPPKRGPGHRGADVRDTVAEMAARAQEISQEAGSKMASAMRDVITAAAGLSGFAVDSARDLVQYMVRRGQMTQEEADKLIREAEEAASKRKVNLPPPPSKMPKPTVPAPTAPVVMVHAAAADHKPESAHDHGGAHPAATHQTNTHAKPHATAHHATTHKDAKADAHKKPDAHAAKKAVAKHDSHHAAKKPAAKVAKSASKPAAKKATKKR